MRVIEAKASASYAERVAATLLRLMALFALILMPAGMGMGPAAAASHETVMAEMAADEHCDSPVRDSGQDGQDQVRDCALACTVLLAEPGRETIAALSVRLETPHSLEQRLSGGEPEIATPPPKQA